MDSSVSERSRTQSKGNNVLSVDVDVRAVTALIVSGYLSGPNKVPAEQLPNLVGKVGGLVCEIAKAQVPAAHASASPVTAGGSRRKAASTPETLSCLECGMKMKMLKRHLLTVHGMTPEGYRLKHDLPGDAPMVTSGYAEQRSQIAKASGLGKKPEDRERIRSTTKR